MLNAPPPPRQPPHTSPASPGPSTNDQPLAIALPPPRPNRLPDWDVVKDNILGLTYATTRSPNAPSPHYRNQDVRIAAGLHTFQRCTEAPYVIVVTFRNTLHRDIRMTVTMAWTLLQSIDNQHHSDHNTSIDDWLQTLSSLVPPPQAVRTWTQHVFASPDNEVPCPSIAAGHCLLLKDRQVIAATYGILPLSNPPAWIVFEPCAPSGVRWRVFHSWRTCATQLKHGLIEASSLGDLTFDSISLGNPRFP